MPGSDQLRATADRSARKWPSRRHRGPGCGPRSESGPSDSSGSLLEAPRRSAPGRGLIMGLGTYVGRIALATADAFPWFQLWGSRQERRLAELEGTTGTAHASSSEIPRPATPDILRNSRHSTRPATEIACFCPGVHLAPLPWTDLTGLARFVGNTAWLGLWRGASLYLAWRILRKGVRCYALHSCCEASCAPSVRARSFAH